MPQCYILIIIALEIYAKDIQHIKEKKKSNNNQINNKNTQVLMSVGAVSILLHYRLLQVCKKGY